MKNADWALMISLGILWCMTFVFVELLLAYLSPFMIVYLWVAIILADALVPHETLTINRVVGAVIGVVGVTTAIGYQNIFQL
jgi:hypothetical protein